MAKKWRYRARRGRRKLGIERKGTYSTTINGKPVQALMGGNPIPANPTQTPAPTQTRPRGFMQWFTGLFSNKILEGRKML